MAEPIKTEKQYEEALARVFTLIQNDSQNDAKLSGELEELCIFIKEHELGRPSSPEKATE